MKIFQNFSNNTAFKAKKLQEKIQKKKFNTNTELKLVNIIELMYIY